VVKGEKRFGFTARSPITNHVAEGEGLLGVDAGGGRVVVHDLHGCGARGRRAQPRHAVERHGAVRDAVEDLPRRRAGVRDGQRQHAGEVPDVRDVGQLHPVARDRHRPAPHDPCITHHTPLLMMDGDHRRC
jgi:hypothetical protein